MYLNYTVKLTKWFSCCYLWVCYVHCRHCFNDRSGHSSQSVCWMYTKLPEWGPGMYNGSAWGVVLSARYQSIWWFTFTVSAI